MPIEPSSETPFREASGSKSQMQFSLSTLLLVMAVFAVMSACLVFAAQLPLVSREIHAWLGSVPSENKDGSDRFVQLLFLLICYSAPLLVAAVLNAGMRSLRALQAWQARRSRPESSEWEME
jgi:hypothetical protein